MTVAISNGIVFLLLFLQNAYAQQGVNNNGVSQPKSICNTAGVNYNSAQPGQQINWQQPSNMQLAPVSQQPQNFQQSGMMSQVKQQSPLSDIFSALQSVRFSSQKHPSPSSGFKQSFDQAPSQPQSQQNPTSSNQQILQYANQVPESSKPTFTFQFVPVSPQNSVPEYQVQNAIPVQLLTSGQNQMASQTGSSYYTHNQPTSSMASQQVPTTQGFQTSSGQSQPIVFTVNSQQPGQNQPMVYTLQPAQPFSRSGNQQKAPQPVQPNIALDDTMALLMSQLQSSSANPDIASILPMLMNSKQDKSGGMKALLPLILSLLTDKGCGCPHCGCPCSNGEPTINGGYSNQINYSQLGLTDDIAKFPDLSKSCVKKIEKSMNAEVIQAPKQKKTNEINDGSEEASDEDEDYEYDDD